MPKSIPSKIKLTHILLECMSKSWRSVYPETRWRHNQIFSAYAWRFAGAEKRLTRSTNYHLRTPTKYLDWLNPFSTLSRIFVGCLTTFIWEGIFLSGAPDKFVSCSTRSKPAFIGKDSVHSLSAFRLIDARENKIPIYFEPIINHSSSGLWREVWMVTLVTTCPNQHWIN